MRNRKQQLNKSLWLVTLSLFTLLLMVSCSNRGNNSQDDEKLCTITPELAQALEKYNVESIGENFLIVSEYDPTKDNDDYRNKHYGCMNTHGKLLLPVIYNSLQPIGGDLLKAQNYEEAQGTKIALIYKNGENITGYIYDGLGPLGKRSCNYFLVKKDGKLGIIDRQGEVMIPLEYDEIYDFYDGYKCYDGFTNSDYIGSRPMKLFRYFSTENDYDDAFYLVKNGDGIVVNLTVKNNSQNGKHVDSPFDYQRIKRNGKYGYVNCFGEEIPCRYQDAAKLFSDGLAAVVQNGKVGFIDKKGDLVIPFQFDYSSSDLKDTDSPLATLNIFSEGYACVKKGNKYGFIDKQGNTVVPFAYDWPGAFHENVAAVMKKTGDQELFGLIDINNNTVLPFEFSFGTYQEHVFIMKKRNYDGFSSALDGLYSPQGECLSPCQYEGTGFGLVFNPQGYAVACKELKFGLVNNKGQELIPCHYDLCSLLSYISESGVNTMSGNVMVKLGDKLGVLDLQNNVVVPVEFDNISPSFLNPNLFIVSKHHSRKGLYDINGNCTLD